MKQSGHALCAVLSLPFLFLSICNNNKAVGKIQMKSNSQGSIVDLFPYTPAEEEITCIVTDAIRILLL
jgi:hypothetical protein